MQKVLIITVSEHTLGRAVLQVARQIAKARPNYSVSSLGDELRQGKAALAEAGFQVTQKRLGEVVVREQEAVVAKREADYEAKMARKDALKAAAEAGMAGGDIDEAVAQANAQEGVRKKITDSNVRGEIIRLNKLAQAAEKREKARQREIRKMAAVLKRAKKNQVVTRGKEYGELWSVGPVSATWLCNVPFQEILPNTYIREISNRYSEAVNVDLYDVTPDLQAVIYQVRETEIDNKKGWSSPRKTYFLSTKQEDESWDEVEVSGHAIQAARKKEEAKVAGYVIERIRQKLAQEAMQQAAE